MMKNRYVLSFFALLTLVIGALMVPTSQAQGPAHPVGRCNGPYETPGPPSVDPCPSGTSRNSGEAGQCGSDYNGSCQTAAGVGCQQRVSAGATFLDALEICDAWPSGSPQHTACTGAAITAYNNAVTTSYAQEADAYGDAADCYSDCMGEACH